MSVLLLHQADVFRLLQGRNSSWLIRGVNLLLVVWIASLLAPLAWNHVTLQGEGPIENIVVSALPVSSDPNLQLTGQLPEWHLMGIVPIKQATAAVDTPVNAPDTRRNLVLRGVLSSEAPGMARAIIADPRGEEDRYAVGDKLPGDAELSEVYPDRVILESNGRFETLRLAPDNLSSRSVVTRSPPRTLPAQYVQRIGDNRQQSQQSPKTLLQGVNARP